MRYFVLISVFFFINTICFAQYERTRESRITAGASLPELFSIGGNIKVTKLNVVGGSFGFLPAGGLLWKTVNAEHHIFFSKTTKGDIIRKYYFRQGLTFTMPSNELSLSASIGVDRELNQNNDGLSFEAGLYYVFGKDALLLGDTKIQLRPAFAIRYYLKYSKRLITRKKYKDCNSFK